MNMHRLVLLRRAAGFTAAGAMSLYLLVKLVWITLELLHGTSDWVLLNAVTVVMALVGGALGLALAQSWGTRSPTWLVLPACWIAGGFLVSMLPFMVAGAVLAPSAPEPADDASMPAWETVLIGVGFAAMAVALVVGLPLFLRERWPHAFTGRIGRDRADARTAWILLPLTALGALWVYWAAGGTAGLDPAAEALWDVNARLLVANSALWAVAGVWSVWTLGRWGSGRGRVWLPMALGFVASGSLFSWGGWKLLWLLLPGMYQPVEHRWVAVTEHGVAIGTGAAVLVVLTRVYRRRASDLIS
ncbi:hypothetical protein ABZ897_18875 [Nonomuraea sp. NPDC046802]|uniref:hypothetical protein n=1 Tax=Nonomuraea sp. NPDC046802 TaxID=3154919 RepID=UPI00340BBA70